MMTGPLSSRVAMPTPRRHRHRMLSRLLSTGCVMGIAMAVAAFHERVSAQSAFQGTGSLTGDGYIISGSAPNTDTIVVNSSAAIDWDVNIATPTGSHDFLPAGSTVNFVDGLGTDFTVLNRINVRSGAAPLLDQVIELNGTITSTVGGNPGGNIWFYTPGGFLIGGTATINVGGLALSTSQIDPTSTLNATGGTLRLTGLENGAPALSAIRIAPGAQISASSYMAMVAPRIEQSGTVTVDGSAVYVAAEAATISMNNGLFDIAVSTGSDDPNGIVHDGATTGSASTGFTDRKIIYLVAVPKNQAMTMLLGGAIGYAEAANAFNDGSAVILSAGNDVIDFGFGPFTSPSGGAGTGSAAISFGDTVFTNSTSVYAPDAITLNIGTGQSIEARSSLNLYAGTDINPGSLTIATSGTGAITVAGNLYGSAGSAPQGGSILVDADGGSTMTFGTLSLNASGSASSSQGAPGLDAHGGTVTVSARNGGSIGFGDNSSFDAGARGGDGSTGGNATGGTIHFIADGGSIAGTGTTYFYASGNAGLSDGTSGLASGDGAGGDITIETSASGGILSFGTLSVDVLGNNNADPDEPFLNVGDGGRGIGGSFTLSLRSGTLTADQIEIFADGTGIGSQAHDSNFGASPFASGDGIGGTALFSLTGGDATITALSIHADGYGGLTDGANSGQPIASLAGNGTGGAVSFVGTGGSLMSNDLSFSADGYGGRPTTYGGFGMDGANAGNGTGGMTNFTLSGTATVTAPALSLSASGYGAQGGTAFDTSSFPPPTSTLLSGNGGNGAGGSVSLSLEGGALTSDGIILSASGAGGAGGENETLGLAGSGGSGTGGTAGFSFTSEGHNIGTLAVGAAGSGGAGGAARYIIGYDQNSAPIYAYDAGTGGAGGNGTGGSAGLTIVNDPTLASLSIDASGVGGTGGDGATGGTGGDGFGGTGGSGAQLLLTASTLTVTGATDILSNGTGGSGGIGYIGLGGDGGNGFGGDASILAQNGSTLTLASTTVIADGIGGSGGDGGAQGIDGVAGSNGGSGTGGSALIRAESNAAVTLGGDVLLRADGSGADGREGSSLTGLAAANGGNAGDGSGGSASVEAATGGTISQNATASFLQSASGTGGNGANGLGTDADGGNGGNGTSGRTTADLASGGSFAVGDWVMMSMATAGNGGAPTGAGTTGIDGTESTPATSGVFLSLADAGINGTSATLLSDSSIAMDAGGSGAMTLTGDFTAIAADTIGFTHISRPASTPVTLSANAITLMAGGDITASGDTRLRAASDFSAESLLGGISLTDIGSGADTILIALNGGILVSTDLDAGGLVSADGTDIAITSLTDISFDHATASAGGIAVTATGNATFLGDATAAGGDIILDSGSADIIGDMTASSGNILLTSAGDMAIDGTVTARAITLASGGSTTLSGAAIATTDDIAMTTGDAIISGSATADAGDFTLMATGIAEFIGTATAANIAISSRDIDILSGAGLFATNDITLVSSDNGAANYIGGGDVTGAYSLSSAEIFSLFARNLTITTPTQTIVGDIAINSGSTGAIDPDGIFTIDSAGRIWVEGAVGLTGLVPTGGLILRAGNGIDVVTDSASIDLRDGVGALGGTLLMESGRVTAATQAAIDDIFAPGTSIFARNNRLAQNDGVTSEDGFLRAGTIGIAATEGIYIQNSGASTDTDARRGFTTNAMTLTTSAGGAEIVINGRLVDANGDFATGLATLQQVVINGQTAPASGYAAGSTINGCLIANPASCMTPLSPTDPASNIPHRNEDIARELDPSTAPGIDGLPTVIIEIKDFEAPGFPPLIDEPVTGNGNDDLWTSAGCIDARGAGCGGGAQP